jgi:hypothetical protein
MVVNLDLIKDKLVVGAYLGADRYGDVYIVDVSKDLKTVTLSNNRQYYHCEDEGFVWRSTEMQSDYDLVWFENVGDIPKYGS